MVDFPTDIDNIVIGAIAGAIFLPVIGACTNALIPIAMSSFSVVGDGDGVGKIHAAMAAVRNHVGAMRRLFVRRR